MGGGGRAGASFLRGGRAGSAAGEAAVVVWWLGVSGGGSMLRPAKLEVMSFNSSSFSVFLAKAKSDTLLWKVTKSIVRSL